MGFFVQNVAAITVGFLAAYASHYLLSKPEPVFVAAIAFCGFIGGYLPHIQQPSQPAYRVVRFASWLMTLLIPLTIFLYRLADLLAAWIITCLFTTGIWIIIDRISLRRDYTRSAAGIILLPLLITACAYAALGKPIIIPAFLACSTGYIVYLLIEQYMQRNWLRTLKKPTRSTEN